MKWILSLFLLIIIFTSCDHPKKPYIEELTWPKRTVHLDNNLGVLTIRLPEEFDTTYFRKIHSDRKCGDYYLREFYKNGFRPSPLEYSDGIVWHIDSIYSFVIERWITSNCENEQSMDTSRMNNIVNFYKFSQTNNNRQPYQYQKKK